MPLPNLLGDKRLKCPFLLPLLDIESVVAEFPRLAERTTAMTGGTEKCACERAGFRVGENFKSLAASFRFSFIHGKSSIVPGRPARRRFSVIQLLVKSFFILFLYREGRLPTMLLCADQ